MKSHIRVGLIVYAVVAVAVVCAASIYEPYYEDISQEMMQERFARAESEIRTGLGIVRNSAFGDPSKSFPPQWVTAGNADIPGPCPSHAPKPTGFGVAVCIQSKLRLNHRHVYVGIPSVMAAVRLPGLVVLRLADGVSWWPDRRPNADLADYTMHPLPGLGLALAMPPPPPPITQRLKAAALILPLAGLGLLSILRLYRDYRPISPMRKNGRWQNPICGCVYEGGLILNDASCPTCAGSATGGTYIPHNKARPVVSPANRQFLEPAGPRVRAYRRQRGLSVDSLATQAEVSPESIRRIESETPEPQDIAAVVRLARHMETTFTALIAPAPTVTHN